MKIFRKKDRDRKAVLQALQAQFSNLQGVDPWLWPQAPKAALFFIVGCLFYALTWYFWLGTTYSDIGRVSSEEAALKESFRAKLTKANNLVFLKDKKQQAVLLVSQLERQLPSTSEMDALLSDINQSGVERGLRFVRLKPGNVEIKDYYAELPIVMQVTGRFHDFAAFTAEIAALSRIVTLHNIQISTSNQSRDTLVIDATAKTYRYLDEAELSAQRKAKREAVAKAGQK